MQTLDFDAYRETIVPDRVKLNGRLYDLRPASFNKTLSFATSFEGATLENPAELISLIARFSEISGLPMEVLDELSIDEVGELFRFFLDRQAPGRRSATPEANLGPENPATPST